VYGYIKYTPSERAGLKMQVNLDEVSEEDGVVFLEGTQTNETIKQMLATKGFDSRDIRRLSTMDLDPVKNQYDEINVKEIPNTIEVDFKSEFLLGERLMLMIYRNRIKEGIPFIPYEERKYHSLMLLLETEKVSEEVKKNILTDPLTNKFYDDVLITIYSPIVEIDRSFFPGSAYLNQALANRRRTRVNFICNHLGISPKHIDKLRVENEPAWKELMTLVYRFEPETITLWGWRYPVYWDFERFIHIYLRHYKIFIINGSSKGQGTGFLYTRKDIRRIIEIVLGENKDGIEKRLEEGKGFYIKNEKGYYFNGNYYSLVIDPDGRLMQFHPQENA
jgi:hypothetical protein